MRYFIRCTLLFWCVIILLSVWCFEIDRSILFEGESGGGEEKSGEVAKELSGRVNTMVIGFEGVRANQGTKYVNIVPTRDTYLCSYMRNATSIPGGCIQSCNVSGRFGPVSFDCYVHKRRYSKAGYEAADILINHNGPVPRRTSNGPPYLTLFYTGESNQTDRKRGSDLYQQQYDMVVSFEHHRTYYYTWTHRHQESFMQIMNSNIQGKGLTKDMIWSEWQARISGVAIFVSRCKARRGKLIRELSSFFDVHSFGKCSRTKSIPHHCQGLERYKQKLCVFRRFKYVLALENSQEKDYVTEKVYHGLLSGAVTLYWGAPNINEFVPGAQNSFVDLGKFLHNQLGDGITTVNATDAEHRIQNLADFLRRLEKDKEAVTRLLEWRLARRAEDWGKDFWDNLHHKDPICNICNEARRRRDE